MHIEHVLPETGILQYYKCPLLHGAVLKIGIFLANALSSATTNVRQRANRQTIVFS